ncbi:alpha/beta hydrolase fold domain-containing protein [Streptomyces coeruleorubidus]|uniref:alpha/beta hydrolase fold domain-containing protein n=1 Tax=Streptomyces coeruleorubidus TaxID=116188 RepID=UPI003158D81F
MSLRPAAHRRPGRRCGGLGGLPARARGAGHRRGPLGVAGDSAGGGLATAVALLVRGRGGPALCAVCPRGQRILMAI